MNKTYTRFFGGLLKAQEKWLNKIASGGCRLVRTTKMQYEFEECPPDLYEYRVEFIGHKSARDAAAYVHFLEDFGYRVWYKNINLNYSVGKVEMRPWADAGRRLATAETTLHRELLIIEKKKDGKPFELHTTYADRIQVYRAYRRPYIFLFMVLLLMAVTLRTWVAGILAFFTLIPIVLYQVKIACLKKQADTQEW